MNENLQSYARKVLREGLAKCNEAQQFLFKRMYAAGKLELTIDEVVDRMPEDRLDLAMQQVERTFSKVAEEPKQIR